MISIPRKQREVPPAPRGVVGMNFRNLHLVHGFRQSRLINIADDKVLTKTVLEANGISSPELLGVISRIYEKEAVYDKLVERRLPFVMKPAKSSKGRGVVIFKHADAEGATLMNGQRMEKSELFFFIQKTLQGEHSFGRPQDGVLVEEKVETDQSWVMDNLPGAPDIRIVLVEGKPALAMARLPTSSSDGRANLHCGAVGVGIDFETYQTKGGIHQSKLVERHPDTQELLAGRVVQDFDQCLELSLKCYAAVPLNLIGIDLMRDKRKGPVVIEINARPGLSIQVANRRGMLEKG